MSQRSVSLCLLFLLSVATLIDICPASKLKALSLAAKAIKELKKFKKLTPFLLLVRKKPVIIVIKKNCQHAGIPELGLGGFPAFSTYDWNSDLHSLPQAEYFH